MIFVLLFLLGVLMIFSYLLLGKDLLAPAVVVCFVFFISTIGCLINSKYWGTQLSSISVFVVFGGCLIFVLISILCKYTMKRMYGEKNSQNVNKLVKISISLWKIIVVSLMDLLLIIMQIRFVNQIASLSSKPLNSWGTKMEYYRNVISYDSSNLHITVPTYINILNKCSMIFAYIFLYIVINNLLSQENKKWYKSIRIIDTIPVFMYILFNLVCATRGGIIQLFIAAIVIFHLLYHKKNSWKKGYSLKMLLKLVLLVTLILSAFVGLRDIVGRNYSETASNPIYYICCYVGGPIHLLNDFIENPIPKSDIWGSETFYSIIRFLGKRLGKADWIYVSHLEFRYSNGLNVGNVYTAFRKYIYDFGYFGVVWCTSIVSFIYNILYYNIFYHNSKAVEFDIKVLFLGYISYGYYYMSIQEQALSTILCTTTIIMPILYIIFTYFLTNVTIKIGKQGGRKLEKGATSSLGG